MILSFNRDNCKSVIPSLSRKLKWQKLYDEPYVSNNNTSLLIMRRLKTRIKPFSLFGPRKLYL